MGAVLLLIPQAAVAAGPAVSAGVFHRPIVMGRSLRHDTVTSGNWSGYGVQSASQFTAVAGTWVQPGTSCATTGATYAAFWVGIDGYSSQSVEQLGTDTDCRSKGHPSYYAWWEMYPANSVSLSTASYPVQPGDTLTGSVTRSGTSYTLQLQSSRGWTFSTVQSGSDANTSAEWVAEAPEICSFFCTNAKLTNFGRVTFSASQAATGGSLAPISSFTADGGPHDIIMTTSSGATRAQPSALDSTGMTFSDTWYRA
jgi:hypothetical protein